MKKTSPNYGKTYKPTNGTCLECAREKQVLFRFAGRNICESCMNKNKPLDIADYIRRSSILYEAQAEAPGNIGRLINKGRKRRVG